MSETDTTPESESTATDADEDEGRGERVRRYANYAVLLVLGILAFVAVIQLYLSVSNAIRTWIEPEYRSLFQAAFNLVVLLAAGLGISYQLRRLYG
ncbi:hypothetical protein DU500_15075 [Haloplanus rubicundus]|uniref:DUF8060 domain-containing protein n=1 Tax=Haloplanus rubicundus TaxID=1547898 RepID=A0A345EFT8_9EURY|nr:hypothetical protein [Haloplanus rubicundus]AXG07645.1 hypothetical protein DU500_15075 [Haloplanus rubicundus]AXG11060.1 hypothetical protein DU484_15045 [Haloplanus rubicundus]